MAIIVRYQAFSNVQAFHYSFILLKNNNLSISIITILFIHNDHDQVVTVDVGGGDKELSAQDTHSLLTTNGTMLVRYSIE